MSGRERGLGILVTVLAALNIGLLVWIIAGPRLTEPAPEVGPPPTSGAALAPEPQPVGPRADLTPGEQALVDLFERTSPAVVFITTHADVRRGRRSRRE